MKTLNILLPFGQTSRRAFMRESFWWICGATAILLLGIYLAWEFWGELNATDPSATIRNISITLGAPIAIVLAVWRSRVAERQAETNEHRLSNDRYMKSSEMLGSNVLSVRLGGIYALKVLAEDQPEYHVQNVGLLCAFVRHPTQHMETTENRKDDLHAKIETESPPVRVDVQAAMEAIGFRSGEAIALERESGFKLSFEGATLRRLVLRRSSLSGAIFVAADLSNARLEGADLSETIFWDADLSNARLGGANLSKAWFHGAPHKGSLAQVGHEMNLALINLNRTVSGNVNLSNAWLNGANLREAHLDGANLSQSDLQDADLSGASLSRINLFGARIDGANLSHVIGLRQEQLDEARVFTDNPPNLKGAKDVLTGKTLIWC